MKSTEQANRNQKKAEVPRGSTRSMLWDSGQEATEGSFRVRLSQSDNAWGVDNAWEPEP